MKRSGNIPRQAQRQRGATAVEFALLFPFLFAVIYGGIAYSFAFFMQQRVNFAAQEAVRAVVALSPSSSDYEAQLTSTIENAVNYSFSSTGVAPPALLAPTHVSGPNNTIIVTVSYSVAGVFPTITLPGLGPLPAVPPVLTAVATGRLS